MSENEKKEIIEKHRAESLKEKNKKEDLKKGAKIPTRPSLGKKK